MNYLQSTFLQVYSITFAAAPFSTLHIGGVKSGVMVSLFHKISKSKKMLKKETKKNQRGMGHG